MPSFSESLEKTLHNALKAASERNHEYATLEHLLFALIDDDHAAEVMRACGVAIDDLFAFITPRLAEAQLPNDVHFKAEGYDLLGQQVAESIRAALQ